MKSEWYKFILVETICFLLPHFNSQKNPEDRIKKEALRLAQLKIIQLKAGLGIGERDLPTPNEIYEMLAKLLNNPEIKQELQQLQDDQINNYLYTVVINTL